MKLTIRLTSFVCFACILLILFCSGQVQADFKIGIMQDKKGAAAKFRPLIKYFNKKNIEVSFVAARNYPNAAKMFSNGEIDGMFSGSGIAGCMIIKGIASPVVRPVNKEGWSTYWAVVLAPKSSSRFKQDAKYFENKRVIFCGLASSGEFFYQSILNQAKLEITIMKASSHGAAIDTLSRKAADIAIVKNRVWENLKDMYPMIQRVGEDPGENPNGTFIVSKKTDLKLVEKISSVLLSLEMDTSAEAKSVKEKLQITGYIKTTIDDFKTTIRLLEKAGVNQSFDFKF